MTDNASAPTTVDIAPHLKNERDALRAFQTLLENEQQALLTQDSEQLLSLAEAKTQATHKLAELSNLRRQYIGSTTLDTTQWIQKNVPSCRDLWNEIRELAARAHQLNQINGEVIQLKLRSNQKALTALLGAAQNAAGLYGRDGHPNLPIAGRTLGSG